MLIFRFLQEGDNVRGFVRRSSLFVIAALMVVSFGTVTQADGPADSGGSGIFSDVPSNHWSIDSLTYLLDVGVIEGLPNGQFQGDRSPSRYEVATLLTRALHYVDNRLGNLDLSAVSTPADTITTEDLQVLQELIFKISDRVQSLSTEVDGIQTVQPGIDPALTSRIRDLESQSDRIELLEAQLTQADQTIKELKTQFTQYQISDSSVSEKDMVKTNQNIVANRIIGLFALGAAVVGIGLMTLR